MFGRGDTKVKTALCKCGNQLHRRGHFTFRGAKLRHVLSDAVPSFQVIRHPGSEIQNVYSVESNLKKQRQKVVESHLTTGNILKP